MAKETKRFNFTVKELESLTCPASGRPAKDGKAWVYDAKTPGLAMLITEAGTRNFYHYRRVKGQRLPTRSKIGAMGDYTIEQARRKAEEMNAQAARGIDPLAVQAEKRKAAQEAAAKGDVTLEAMWTLYLTEHLSTKKEKTVKEFTRLFDTHLAEWKDLDPKTITSEAVEILKAKIGANSTYTANRVLELLSAMYRRVGKRFGMPKKWTPTEDVDAYAEHARDRTMSPEELASVIASIKAEPNTTIRDYFLMLLYTGARKTNVAAMKWNDISWQRNTWKVPGENMKNGSALVVTLIPDALTLLRTREADKRANEVLVFPSRHVTPVQVEQARQMKAEGKSTHVIAKELGVSQHSAWQMLKPEFVAEEAKPFNGAGFAWRRIVNRAGIKSRLTIHDCRRTFCTAQIEAGIPLPIVAGMMGHRSQATTMKHYAIARPDAIAAAAREGTAKMFAEAAAAEATQKAKAKAG